MNASSDSGDEPGALASLGHELRTPLTAIMGFADAMRERAFGPLDDAYARAADTIHAAAGHMAILVDRMTEAAESGQSRLARFDAREVGSRVLRLFEHQARSAGAGLSLDVPASAILVDADATALEQILINLIANALAAGGKRIAVSLAREGGDLILAVTDNGPGLAGTHDGLGLRIVRQLVGAHGGDFSLASPPTGGATASARLPILALD